MPFRSIIQSYLPEYARIFYFDCTALRNASPDEIAEFSDTLFEVFSGHDQDDAIKLDRRRVYDHPYEDHQDCGVQMSHNIIEVLCGNEGKYIAYRGSYVDDCGGYAIITKGVIVFNGFGKIEFGNIGLKIEKEDDTKTKKNFIARKKREARLNQKYCGVNEFQPLFISNQNQIVYYQPIILFVGSLWQYTQRNRVLLTFVHMIQIADEIAKNINKLTSKGIIHADIKSPNIVVRANEKGLIIKIIDFGMSIKRKNSKAARPCGNYLPLNRFLRTSHSSENILSDKFDCYSYGCLVLNIISCWLGEKNTFLNFHTNDLRPHIDRYAEVSDGFGYILKEDKIKKLQNETNKCIDELCEETRTRVPLAPSVIESYFNEIKKWVAAYPEYRSSMQQICDYNKQWLQSIKQLQKNKVPASYLIANMQKYFKTPMYLNNKGYQWIEKYKWKRALNCFLHVLRQEFSNPDAYAGIRKLTTLCLDDEEYTIAIDVCDKVIKVLSPHSKSFFCKGKILRLYDELGNICKTYGEKLKQQGKYTEGKMYHKRAERAKSEKERLRPEPSFFPKIKRGSNGIVVGT